MAKGQVWINSQQTLYLIDALSEISTLRVVNANGKLLLTPREDQVVALVADGLTNREVAAELGLSQHTIKKVPVAYLWQAGDFDPCGTGPVRCVCAARTGRPNGCPATLEPFIRVCFDTMRATPKGKETIH